MQEFGTRAVHVGRTQEVFKPVVPSIVYGGNENQLENSTLQSLEECVASLEHAKYALCYPCGNGTSGAVSQILDVGDHAVVFDAVYHGTRTSFSICEKLGKLEVSFVDLRNPNVLEKHIKNNTKIVWIETPSNPTMKIVDIAAIARILKIRKKDAILVVDNTFMSPYFQNPLLLGADIVMHSGTKYMNGCSDCLMGAIATNSSELYLKLKESRNETGHVPSPLDCFLMIRSLKTLHIRMERHMKNALEVARYLEQHPKVEKVFHPGLASHPQHELAKKQCSGFSGMVSFCIRGGTEDASRFVQNLRVFTLAVSLGSVESLIEIPSLMTASVLTNGQRKEMEISENLIRMSIGIEDAKDLIADLEQAFQKV